MNKKIRDNLRRNASRMCAGFMAANMITSVSVPSLHPIYAVSSSQQKAKQQRVVRNDTQIIPFQDIQVPLTKDIKQITYTYGCRLHFPETIDGQPVHYQLEGENENITSFTPDTAGTYDLKVVPEKRESYQIIITIEKKEISVLHTEIQDKVYDGTVMAQYKKNPVISGAYETVVFSYDTPMFESKKAGEKILVSHNFVLEESSQERYILKQPKPSVANIQKKKLKVEDLAIADKAYDRTMDAFYQKTPSVHVIDGDQVKLNIPSPSYQDVHAGSEKTIIFDGEFSIFGDDAENYTLIPPDLSKITGTIQKAELILQANSIQRCYGEENPKASYTMEGLVKGDRKEEVLLQEPDVSCSIEKFAKDGTYEKAVEIQNGKVNRDYEIVYQNGNLTVKKSDAKLGENYTVNQSNGKNEYFVGDLAFMIRPMQSDTSRYDKISNSPNGPWLNALAFTEDIKNGTTSFYLKDSESGAISRVGKEAYQIDHTKPEIDDISFEVKKHGDFERFLNQTIFQHFFQKSIEVTITASDETSGVDAITYTLEGEDGTITKTVQGKKVKFTLDPNFKGHISAIASDHAGNISNKVISDGVVIEDGVQHVKESKLKINLNSQTKEREYYNQDVALDLAVENQYAGIYRVKYQLGDTNKEEDVSEKGKGMKTQWKKDRVMLSKNINQNHTKVLLNYEDNAGNESTKTRYFNLDISAPEIFVSYDNNEGKDGLFKEKRIAQIVIRERNFDPSHTILRVTKNGKEEKIKPNFSTDGVLQTRSDGSQYYRYVMDLPFSSDGDYTVSLSSVDKAGNKNQTVTYEGESPKEFTIDLTAPKMSIYFDHYDVKNGKYYNKERVATIRVVEHNFSPDDVILKTKGEQGKWQSHGDVHLMNISFSKDGTYILEAKVADLVGNVSEELQIPEFVIDQTLPNIEIHSPKDQSSNIGTVAPEVSVSDVNYENSKTSLTGYKNGKNPIPYETKTSKRGIEVSYDAIAKMKGNDDFYTLKVTAKDLAGNQKQQTIHFTVNRFGSVYTLDKNTKKLNGAYVIKPEGDVVLHEYNPDRLIEKKLFVSKNSQALKSSEKRQSIKEERKGWHHYIYSVAPETFQEEGTYQIYTSSKDQAGNQMSSNEKGKYAELKFGIDKTNPIVDVFGLQNGAMYHDKVKTVKIHVDDNFKLRDIAFFKNGEYYDPKFVEGNYQISYGRSSEEQSLRIVARDLAGNVKDVSYDFHVAEKGKTTKEKQEASYIKKWIVGIAAIGAIITSIFFVKRKKKEK